MTIDFLHLVVVLAKTPSHDEVDRVCDEVDEDFKHLEESFIFSSFSLSLVMSYRNQLINPNLKEHPMYNPVSYTHLTLPTILLV